MRKLVFQIVCIVIFSTVIGLLYNGLATRSLHPLKGPAVKSPKDSGTKEKTKSKDSSNKKISKTTEPQPIGIEETRKLLNRENIVFLDARNPGAYKEDHIKGAISLPYMKFASYFEDAVGAIESAEGIVTYCSGPNCDLSTRLAYELSEMGYKNIHIFKGGWEKWTESQSKKDSNEESSDK